MRFYAIFFDGKNGGVYKSGGALTQRAYNCCDHYSNNRRWNRLPIGCWAM